jgi:hypothetical protein
MWVSVAAAGGGAEEGLLLRRGLERGFCWHGGPLGENRAQRIVVIIIVCSNDQLMIG